ncbi:hypothetical protein [Micropruina sonneratiae]|uniref:hypothetical protein n=1 Tax=Micropruina sonneratiae TaxID=2986940 RepID=UPI0022265D0D|nr:hypothetical protein [Micropruina sp. KQZ13P-5]MCW3157465.1 hypothetical protein [Micropruina sp. KQZ13P-5]
MSAVSAPAAPGRLNEPVQPQQMVGYLSELDAWTAARRSELAALDAEILGRKLSALTPDMQLSLALWQAVKNRYDLLLVTWDSGRVGPAECARLSSLIWGRLDTGASPSAQLAGMAVSLPEACRLSDALVAQLRQKLNLDPNAEQLARRLRDLRAQLERIREQIALEPPASAPAASAQLQQLAVRLTELEGKRERGGDIGGLLGPLEIDAARYERDLIVGGARRRENRDALARARELTDELTAQEEATRQLVAKTVAEVTPAPKYAVPDVAALGPVPNTRAAIDKHLARLGQVGKALQVVQEAYSGVLAERDAQTALVGALRVKAQALGHAGDPDFAALMDITGRLLARRPAPLAVVRQLLPAAQALLDALAEEVPR